MFRSRPGFCQRLARFCFAGIACFGLLTTYAKEPVRSETKTYCVGRFLVDTPKEAEINGQGYEFMFGRIESERSGIDAKGFTALMEKREEDIKSGALEGKYQLTKTLTPLPNSRLFVASRTLFQSTAYAIDTHRLDGGILFSMKQDSFGPEKIDSVVDRLQKNLLAHLRARQSNEIPTEPGFCIKDGFIADDGSKDQAEYGQIGFRFKAWPDVLIVFTTRENGDKLDDTLLERYAKSQFTRNTQTSLVA
jgi:hypothetical protein